MADGTGGFEQAKKLVMSGEDFELFCDYVDEDRCDVTVVGIDIFEMTNAEFDALCELAESDLSHGNNVRVGGQYH